MGIRSVFLTHPSEHPLSNYYKPRTMLKAEVNRSKRHSSLAHLVKTTQCRELAGGQLDVPVDTEMGSQPSHWVRVFLEKETGEHQESRRHRQSPQRPGTFQKSRRPQ